MAQPCPSLRFSTLARQSVVLLLGLLLGLAALLVLPACGDADGADADSASDTADEVTDSGPSETGDAGPDTHGETTCDDACSDVTDTAPPPPPQRGPGLGNLHYTEDELFQAVGWVNTDTGVPEPHPDFLITSIKPFGTNVAYMHNGYMVTLFAPDSGSGPGGLLFYDVSDPRNPTLVNRVYDAHGITRHFREAHSIGFSNFDGRQHAALHTGEGIEIWDFHNVHDPHPLSRLALPGVAAGDYLNVAWQLFWQGDVLYVAGSTRGLYIVDVRDPLAPVLADRDGRPNPVPPAELGGFRIGPLFAVGNLMVLSSMDDTGGFATLDISDPLHPTLLDSRTRGIPVFYAICLAGNRIILSVRGSRARMSVWDISDPFRIRLEDDSLLIPEQLYCTTQDDYVFQGAEPEAVKVDITTPGDFRITGRGVLDVPNVDHGQVTAFGNLLFIGNDHGTGSAFMPHQREPDTTPPRVSMVHPADDATLQSIQSRVGLIFTDNVELHTVDSTTILIRPEGGEPLAGRYTAQGHIVNFTPEQPLEPDTTYEVVVPIGGVEDWAGNPIDVEHRSTFRTASASAGAGTLPRLLLEAPAPAPAGTPITLTATTDGQAPPTLRHAWNFGDGTPWTEPSEDASVTHTWEEPGNYTVVVRATNGGGWTAATARVTVHGPLDERQASTSATLLHHPELPRAYAANRDGDTVTAIDVDARSLLWEVPVGDGPRAVTLDADGHLWAAVEREDLLVRLDPQSGHITRTVALGHGARPMGVAAHPEGHFVATTLAGPRLLRLVFPDGPPTDIPLDGQPGGLSVDDQGRILVSRFLGDGPSAMVWQVRTDADGQPEGEVEVLWLHGDTETVDGEDRGRGLPNYLGAPVLRPGSSQVWVPATSANIYRGLARDGLPLTHENTVRAVALRVDASSGEEVWPRMDFNDRALPVHVAFSPLGNWAWVTLMGSNLVTLVDAWTGATVGALTSVGDAPETVALSPDGRTVLVHAFLSRTVLVFDVGELLDGTSSSERLLGTIPLMAEEPLSPTVLQGKRIFHNAADHRMSRDGYISCASCHLDGGHDGLTWDFTDRGEGLRNTIDLRGRAGMAHGPLHWTANFDEIQDFENDIRQFFGGTGFLANRYWATGTRSDPLGDPKAGLSEELDALAAYVSSLDAFPRSPFREADGSHTEAARRGAIVFEEAGCASCHVGTAMTDSGRAGSQLPRHDVGTASADSGFRRGEPLDGFDTPTLRGLHDTAPYLHNGSAATLEALFTEAPEGTPHDLRSMPPEDLADLIRWLNELE